ncbi:MAG: hypothetical protein PWQ62_1062 [Candidatus Methanomethylophilaceae archaeon]|nr:hypothetical protein [Candidatus Methanomethylophilaceae archaeon]
MKFFSSHDNPLSMSDIEEKDFQDEDIEKALKAIERRYGFIPFINQVLSTRPDFFIPQIELSKAVFTNPGALSEREKELIAIGVACAICAEHCMDVHISQARKLGADRDQIFEAMMVGSFVALNKTQSYSFRKLHEAFERK